MENNVIISIQGKQSFEAQGDDTIELVTEGCLEPDGDDGYTLSYQESELTGLEGTLTTFQIERDRVTLLRVGEVNSQMVFQEGRRHLSMYNTPYGAMAIGVNTRHLLAELDDRGGEIEIDYAIEHCGANWNEQCAECAQDYLDSMSMSRSELYDQLEYEGFTSSQIAYGLAAVGY